MRQSVIVLEDDKASENAEQLVLDTELFDVAHRSVGDLEAMIVRGESPDAILINVAAATAWKARDTLVAASAQLKKDPLCEGIPMIALSDEGATSNDAATFSADDCVKIPVNSSHLAMRIISLSRISRMNREFCRRHELALHFGLPSIDPDILKIKNDATVLFVGVSQPFLAMQNAVACHYAVAGALTADNALDILGKRPFDLVVVDVEDEEGRYLLDRVRHNPELNFMPIVYLSRSPDYDNDDQLFEMGASEVIHYPIDVTEFSDRIQLLVEEYQIRQNLRTIYSYGRQAAISDGLSGFYNRGYFMEHAKLMIEEAERTGEPFSVFWFRIANLSEISAENNYVVGDKCIQQVGRLASHLMRGEDLIARYNGAQFAITLPGTDLERAEQGVRRILSIVNATEFSVPTASGPIKIDLESNLVCWNEGESVEELMTRATGG